MKRIRITVTQEDIGKGLRYQADRCPVALAAQRMVGPKAVVHAFSWEPEGCYAGPRLPVTAVLRRFIRAFDRGEVVYPQTFYLAGSK